MGEKKKGSSSSSTSSSSSSSSSSSPVLVVGEDKAADDKKVKKDKKDKKGKSKSRSRSRNKERTRRSPSQRQGRLDPYRGRGDERGDRYRGGSSKSSSLGGVGGKMAPYRGSSQVDRRGGYKEPPLPSYALKHIPQQSVDAYKASTEEEPRSSTGMRLIGELAFMPEHEWKYWLKDERRRSFAGHLPCPFTYEQTDRWFRAVKSGCRWRRPQEMPRGDNPTNTGLLFAPSGTCWLTANGCTCQYKYGGFEVSAQEFPGWMYDILRNLMPYCGITKEEHWPNSCTVALYDNGGSSVSWHCDDHENFQGTLKDMRVVSLSLGATRTFEMRQFVQKDMKATERCTLEDGDLMTMEGMCQKHYEHRIPPEGEIQKPRINLSWRWVIKHTKICPSIGVGVKQAREAQLGVIEPRVDTQKLKLAYMPMVD